MKVKHLIIICGLFFSCALSATTIEEAMLQYDKQEFENAFKSFNELAAIGNTKAQFNIGVMYARGEYVKTDLVESWAWFKLVEENNVDDNTAGEDTAKVLAVVGNRLGAEELARAKVRLEELKSRYSNSAIEKNLLPTSTTNDLAAAFIPAKLILSNSARYPRSAVSEGASGVVDVEYMVEKDGTVRYPSVMATHGNAFSSASLKAVMKNRFIPASLNGKPVHEYGQRRRYIFQLQGAEKYAKKVKKNIEPLKKEAMEGGGYAKYTYAYNITMISILGIPLENGKLLKSENANMWFSKAAQDGFSPAKYEIGKRLAYGQSCAVDAKKALFWLEQAADQGLAEAKLMLGMEYISGARTQRNIEKGKELIKGAADIGFEHAILRYAWIVATSAEINKEDLALAESYFNKVEQKDYPDLLSYYETMTVLKLAQGESKEAEKAWEKGMKELKKRDVESWRLPNIKKAMDSGQAYVEPL